MKKGLFWSLIIASAPSYSFATEAVDCDELAKHIEEKVTTLYPFAATKGDAMIITHSASRIVADGPFLEKRQEYWSPCKRSWDSESEYLAKPHPLDKLPASLKQLEKFEAALVRCSKAAPKSCSFAQEIIFKIQTKKMLNSKCTELYAQSVKEHKVRWTAERLATEEKASKLKAFDAYIDDSKR